MWNTENHSVTVRVPVEQFQTIYDAMLALGEVINRQISAEDITDRYFDRELRLRTSIVARDRLIALLEIATNENEN